MLVLALVPELQETSVWIGGMSKAYAMTGWRMGFLAGPPEVVACVGAQQSQLSGSANAISQHASIAALRDGGADRARMHSALQNLGCSRGSPPLIVMPPPLFL